MDLPDAEAIKKLIQALAPGIIILGIRRQFIVGPPPDLQTSAISYAMVSAVYFTATRPLRTMADASWPGYGWQLDVAEYFVLPLLIGSLLAAMTVNRTFDPLLRKFGFQPIHHIPTAWDWVFGGRMPESWVIATLNNGTKYAGIYGVGSYASSSGGERDLFISEVWDAQANAAWVRFEPKRSILLCGRDIRSVEFFGPVEREHVEKRKTAGALREGLHTRTPDRQTTGRPPGTNDG